MDDLISRKKLLKMMSHWKPYMDMGLVRQAVERMPAVDAVEVVRCKDCKHLMEYCSEWKENTGAHGDCRIRKFRSCDEDFIRRKHNDFCSDGERKEND